MSHDDDPDVQKRPILTLNAKVSVGFSGQLRLPPLSPARNVLVPAGNGCGYAGRPRYELTALERKVLGNCHTLARRLSSGNNVVRPKFFELGCGTGVLSVGLVRNGGFVTAVDRENLLCQEAQDFCHEGLINAIIKPAEKLYPQEIPNVLHGFVAQRFLHWLPYNQARGLLKRAADKMQPGARLYVTVAGFSCPLGQGYAHTEKTPLRNRYAPSHPMDGAFGQNITLYTGDEIFKLLRDTGFDADDLHLTEWGLWSVFAKRNDTRILKYG
jgi:SAM-dependent methyltransferase